MKPKVFLILIYIVLQFPVLAQQVITSAGDNPKNNTASLQWTLGQIVTGSATDGNTTLIHGFQQSTLIVSSIFESDDLDYTIKVYPNPVNDYLNIDIDKLESTFLSVSFYDITGKMLLEKGMLIQKLTVDLSGFNAGTYILHITEKNKIIGKYKIIKQ